MATRIVKLPDIGEGVAEAEVSAWHVKIGDLVREDQPLADVMTDKATVEIPSPVSGRVVALGGEAGQLFAVGSELVHLELDAADETVSPATPTTGGTAPAAEGPSDQTIERRVADSKSSRPEPVSDRVTGAAPATEQPSVAPHSSPAKTPMVPRPNLPPRPEGEKPLAPPAVRRRALEAGVDLRRVRGTGPAGRISHNDLDAYCSGSGEPEAPSGPTRRAPNEAVETTKIIGLRRRIAQRMAEAKRRAAHFSYVDECDVTELEALRAQLNARYVATRPKLTLIPFLIAALVRTLPDFPQMNALYDDEAEVIARHGGAHVGIATQTDSGLMVPVVRHAETLDLWECASEVKRLASAARDGYAARDELSGSTITITSLGALGGIVTTPVLNRPEVAILGVNKQVMRPLWRDGTFVPRLTMNLSASFDHRVVDGYDAARFVQALRDLLEAPALLLVDP